MITLKDFRDQTRHLSPDTLLGLSFDDRLNENVITLRNTASKGMETIVECGLLDPVDCDEED